MNKYYDIDFQKLIRLLLPVFLRKSLIITFLSSMIRPVILIYNQFKSFADFAGTDIKSQTCRLQGLLNDTYDYYDRRIVVRDVNINYDNFFIYDEGEGPAVPLPDEGESDASIWVNEGKLGAIMPDFEVVFPAGYVLTGNDENSLRRIINDNKLASKKYRIVYE
jgi:hypothetical protein